MDRTKYKQSDSCMYNPSFSLLSLNETRKKSGPQSWAAGCSFAWGHGLKENEEPYPLLVSNYFDMQCSMLARSGASIEYAADQILRSDIRKNDLVIWGLTSLNRFSWFYKGNIIGVTPRLFEDLKHTVPKEELDHLLWMFFDDNRLKTAVQSIFQVKNFCHQVSANLVLVAHLELSEEKHLESFVHYLESTDCYLDLYSDEEFLKNLDNPIVWRGKKRHYCDYGSTDLDLYFNEEFLKNLDNPIVWRGKKRHYCDYGSTDISTGVPNVVCHPGPKTHRIWADTIIKYLEIKNTKIVDQTV